MRRKQWLLIFVILPMSHNKDSVSNISSFLSRFHENRPHSVSNKMIINIKLRSIWEIYKCKFQLNRKYISCYSIAHIMMKT